MKSVGQELRIPGQDQYKETTAAQLPPVVKRQVWTEPTKTPM